MYKRSGCLRKRPPCRPAFDRCMSDRSAVHGGSGGAVQGAAWRLERRLAHRCQTAVGRSGKRPPASHAVHTAAAHHSSALTAHGCSACTCRSGDTTVAWHERKHGERNVGCCVELGQSRSKPQPSEIVYSGTAVQSATQLAHCIVAGDFNTDFCVTFRRGLHSNKHNWMVSVVQ